MELLKKLGLGSKARQRVERLSGGEQQRTAIARALINDPGIIVADEPTAHLDTELAESFMETLAEFKREGKTIMISSHDPLVFNAGMVDQVVSMRDGMIVV